MCVNFDRLVIYKYLFAEDTRPEWSYEGWNKLSKRAIRVFCGELQSCITEKARVNTCYEFVCFSGFDISSRELLCEDGVQMFAWSRNAVVALDRSAIKDSATSIESAYREAYGDDVIPDALRVAREKALAVGKAAVKNEAVMYANRAERARRVTA